MKPTDIIRLRSRIAALQSEREALVVAGPNAAERAALVRDYCKHAGSAANVGIAYAFATGDLGPALKVRADPSGTLDLAPLLAAVLGPDALAEALCRHIADDDGPDAATRSARLVSIDTELDKLHNTEEDLVEASEAAGSPIPRRADAPPAVVLRVRAAP